MSASGPKPPPPPRSKKNRKPAPRPPSDRSNQLDPLADPYGNVGGSSSVASNPYGFDSYAPPKGGGKNSAPMPTKAAAPKKDMLTTSFERHKNEDADTDDEFEEDMEEDVMDRTSLKKQSHVIVDKGAKKKSGRKKKKGGAD